MAAIDNPNANQRLIHLLSTLIESRYGLSKDRIREIVYSNYLGASQDGAFEKIFTRDKAQLRENGVRIDVYEHLGQECYNIDQDETLLSLELSPAEAAILATVRKMFIDPKTDLDLSLAIRRIMSSMSVSDNDDEPIKAVPVVASEIPSVLADCSTATAERRPIQFNYYDEPKRRTVLPYRVNYLSGRWYLTGFDKRHQERRMFRMSKMGNKVTLLSPQEYDVPPMAELDAEIEQFWNPPKDKTATIALRKGYRRQLLHQARKSDAEPISGYDMFELDYADEDNFAIQVVRAGPGVLVIDPPELRAKVVAELERLSDLND